MRSNSHDELALGRLPELRHWTLSAVLRDDDGSPFETDLSEWCDRDEALADRPEEYRSLRPLQP